MTDDLKNSKNTENSGSHKTTIIKSMKITNKEDNEISMFNISIL